MGIRALQFFSSSEEDAITRAIEKAEKKTSGEIAVMVLDESDRYGEALFSGSMISAVLFALIIEFIIAGSIAVQSSWSHESTHAVGDIVLMVFQNASLWHFLPLALVLFFPFRYLISRLFPSFKLLFVPQKRIDETVREKALISFYEKGLYRTRDATGILIFISLLEHRVWILGDRGINEKISKDFWRGLADELTEGIKTGAPCKSVCTVIEKCTVELERHFPVKSDDTNELTDRVIY